MLVKLQVTTTTSTANIHNDDNNYNKNNNIKITLYSAIKYMYVLDSLQRRLVNCVKYSIYFNFFIVECNNI